MRSQRALEYGTAALIAVGALALYVRTLAPGVISITDDTLEFQLVAARGAIPHPTGYPLYALLLTWAARQFPFEEVAYRANLLSAVVGSGAALLTYLAARTMGSYRSAALLGAALLVIAPTFWLQATVAEVYTLHILIVAAMVWLLFRWGRQVDKRDALGESSPGGRMPLWSLFFFGLGLAHHRTIVLWAPALLLYVALKQPALLRPGVHWVRAAAIVLTPLLLYLYLPLRSGVGSVDGTYDEVGFRCWVLACQYTGFFAGNADSAYPVSFWFDTTLGEIGWEGTLLATLGLLGVYRTSRALLAFFLAALLFNAGFAMFYRVADAEVFWLPTVWLLALLAAGGVHLLIDVLFRLVGTEWRAHVLHTATVSLLLVPLILRSAAIFPEVDRSGIEGPEGFNAYDALAEPLPADAVIIGLLGEVAYLRYVQDTAELSLFVDTVAVPTDPADARFAAIEQALSQGLHPFLTRELPGAGERWSLSALGPLIEVLPQPRSRVPDGLWPLNVPVTEEITLAAWTLSPVERSTLERVTLAWQVEAPIRDNLQVSARLIGAEGEVLAQKDHLPVNDAYPTTQWRPGEVILDTYELPPPPPGSHYLFILYHAEDGTEVGRATIFP